MSDPQYFKKSTVAITIVLLVALALLSVFVIAKAVTKPDFNASTIESLDQKKATVLKLTATAAATSTALSFIPGDTASPIANEIADLSTYFIFILGAILLEKILLSVVGYITFTYIIPAACLVGALYVLTKHELLFKLALKLAVFGLVLFFTIPISIQVSDLIYESYQHNIDQSIDTAQANNATIEDTKSEFAQEDKNWLEKIGDYVSDVTTKIGADIQAIVKRGEESLGAFIEAIATMLIISCLIPIVVILIFVYAVKMAFGIDISQYVKGRKPFL